MPAPSLWASECFSSRGLRTRITFKQSLVQNKKLDLQRTASMGSTPDNRRLGVSSRRGTKMTVRDHGEEDRFSSW